MSWYRTGTIALTNGSTAVTGTGTDFLLGVSVGEGLLAPDGKVYEIASIQSSTGLTLGSPYLGSTASGQSFAIIPSQSYMRDLASQAATLVNSYQAVKDGAGQGKFPDGTQAVPGIRFTADENTGLRRTGADSMALVAGGADKARVDTSGLVLLVARLRNVADTFSGLLQNTITAARTWTFPDKDGTVAMVSDITKAQVGLGNADNTSDASKPVSTAQQAALDLKAPHVDPAVTNALHSGAVVKNVGHDTSKDSDGGAWRERCQHTSWYNESLGFTGKWLGQLATTAAAWATSGAAAGDGFQNSTDGKYYVLTGTSTASEITRGNVRKAPALPLLVAQNTPMARVVVYDGTQSTRPMWRVFAYTGKTINSVRMLDGKLFVGTTTGLFVEDLVADSIGKAERYTSTTTPAIVNSSVNDVAVTALETAPIDAATGLPTPTIAVGTAGGGSVIKDDGTVVHSSHTGSITRISIVGATLWTNFVTGVSSSLGFKELAGISSSWAFTFVTTPQTRVSSTDTSTAIAQNIVASFSNLGICLLKHNQSSPTKGMVAYISNTYPTGWLVGDIRRAWLADTTAETVTGVTQADRCVKNKPLTVVGSLVKAPVATGAGLVAYSGFSASNYAEEAYSADLDFGTADFEKLVWVAVAATQTALETIWCRDSATTGKRIKLQVNASGYLTAEAYDGTTSRVATGTVSVRDGVYRLVSVRYVAATGTLTIKVNNTTYASATGTPLLTLSNASAVFRVGLDCQGANPGTSVSACLLRVSATVASDDQMDYIYRTEWPLFQAGAQCTLAGSSASVAAPTYDPDTTLLQAGTSWGRSSFKDLLRVDSEATSVGAITSLSAVGGVVLTGGASSARVYMPALSLRDELRRKAEARKALGKVPVFFDTTAVSGQTVFAAPKEYRIKAVYHNGTLKREATTGVYWSRSHDGFIEYATISVGASASDWISLMCVRV